MRTMRPGSWCLSPLLAGACALGVHSASTSAGADCPPQWESGHGYPGVTGVVYATTLWDPDGPGPRTPLVAVAGAFTVAGSIPAGNIAAYDPATGVWATLGAGVNGQVNALCALSNGDLVVGGDFTTAGGSAAARVAVWSAGSQAWSTMGAGMPATVSSLTSLPGGDVIAGGSFTTAGGNPASRVARWNGTVWTAMGVGFNTPVLALATLTTGDVIAGGSFFVSGGNCIARWNGTAWVTMAGGATGTVRALAPLPGGAFVAGGDFFNAGNPSVSVTRVAKYDGAAWHAMGVGLNAPVRALAVMADGRIAAGGEFTGSGPSARYYTAVYDGTSWQDATGGVGSSVNALTALPSVAGGGLIAAGTFLRAGGAGGSGGLACSYIASWSGAAWTQLSIGLDSGISCFLTMPDGTYYIGGAFTTVGGIAANRVAYFNGVAYVPVGTGFDATVNALARLPGGDIVAGGSFVNAGGSLCPAVARWNGSAWSPLGTGLNVGAVVNAMAVTGSGDLFVGGDMSTAGGAGVSNVARWNGTSWSSGSPGLGIGLVRSMLAIGGNQLLAGGDFASPSPRLARFDGTNWVALGTGADSFVNALALLPDGRFVAGGRFLSVNETPANRVAVGQLAGNSVSWSPLGAGVTQVPFASCSGLAVHPSGDVLVGGVFTSAGGAPAANIARYSFVNSAWSTFGSGMFGPVSALATLPSGDIIAGGGFTSAGGNVSVSFARWTTPLSPDVVDSPGPRSACPEGATSFTVVASGQSPLSYHWEHGGVPVDGLANPSALTPTLSLTSVQPGDGGEYRCVVTNTCGSDASTPALLTVESCCPADVGAQGGVPGTDGTLDNNDFVVFIDYFFTSNPSADRGVQGGIPGVDGLYDNNDFIVFIDQFFAACGP